MATVTIPEPLHQELRRRAEESGTSVDALVVRALEDSYGKPKRGKRVTGPMVRGKGKLGPRFPVDENPHDLVLS